MTKVRKWTTTELTYLMMFGHKKPWSEIAEFTGRSEGACKAQYEKIRKLRIHAGTWKGL